jgi:hypothetical protein
MPKAVPVKVRPIFWLASLALAMFLFGLESSERTITLRTLRAERKCLRYRDPIFGATRIEVRNSDGTYEYIGTVHTECRKAKGIR